MKKETGASEDPVDFDALRNIADKFLTLYRGDRAKLARGFLLLLGGYEKKAYEIKNYPPIENTRLSYKKNLVTEVLQNFPPISVAEGIDRQVRLLAEALAEYVFAPDVVN